MSLDSFIFSSHIHLSTDGYETPQLSSRVPSKAQTQQMLCWMLLPVLSFEKLSLTTTQSTFHLPKQAFSLDAFR